MDFIAHSLYSNVYVDENENDATTMGQGKEVRTITTCRGFTLFFAPNLENAQSNPSSPRIQERRDEVTVIKPNTKEQRQRVDMEANVKESLLRFMVMGKKTLPDLSKPSTAFWGFVELVTTNIEDIKPALKGEKYDTGTRGHRHKPPARPLGEGIYRLLRHNPGNRTHTHLVYKLEFPPKEEKKEPQESLNIEREGSFVIQIKNPEQGGRGQFQGLQSKRKAVFPAHLHGEFGRRKFIPADPPDLLNYEGCEFLLISASDDVEELGLELETEEGGEQPECSDLVTTFGECASAAPLFKGTWVFWRPD
ncbi:hypothetical protein Scep_023111 [Stephania cephalantha]|uniref:Uncharacterized protein n=1 Tax=Stephania cephalantha TaxID=152367 RepID=A0AAP0EU23_9MAGN